MRIVVAPDKFKGSLSSTDAALAIVRGAGRGFPGASFAILPMADGGEGTVEALVEATRGYFPEVTVSGPLGRPVVARIGLLRRTGVAAIEMASASGLGLVAAGDRDVIRASTFGTGQLLLAAIDRGVGRVIVGIGGSATNDGGAGLAQALGYRLLDVDGVDLPPGGGALGRLDRIEAGGRDPRLDRVEVAVACDVDNPLCGPRGASAVYGPQKGATPDQVTTLDANLGHLARIIRRDLGVDVLDIPGGGAAGGLGAGLVAFAGGRLESGISLVIGASGLAETLRGADLCLTGEGALDASSAHGKAVVGVARLARSLGCPTIALVGTIGPGAEAVLTEGVDAYFTLCPGPTGLDQATARAAEWLERAAEQAVRAFAAGRRPRSE